MSGNEVGTSNNKTQNHLGDQEKKRQTPKWSKKNMHNTEIARLSTNVLTIKQMLRKNKKPEQIT